MVDRGRGIPNEDLERVFQKFCRLESIGSADGIGLGLFICKEFVEAHRGQIRLEINSDGVTMAKNRFTVSDITISLRLRIDRYYDAR